VEALAESHRGDNHKLFGTNTWAWINMHDELVIVIVEEEQPTIENFLRTI
jgi:hypothetical protein